MATPKVWTFFYGSFMNFEVLKKAGLVPEKYEVAKLSGFDICIQPLANLVRSDQHCVYGILTTATYEELRHLYVYAQNDLGGTYLLPEPVLVQTLDGKWRSALCYIAPMMEPRPPGNDYIDRIVRPARHFGFPDWYVARLESFRPG